MYLFISLFIIYLLFIYLYTGKTSGLKINTDLILIKSNNNKNNNNKKMPAFHGCRVWLNN